MITEKPHGTKEKVRGMNASLSASNGSGALSERDPGKLHITRRQIAFAIVLAALGVIAAIYTVDAVASGQQTFPAQVTSSKVYNLNFANNGKVTDVLVKIGQSVSAGQVLARQDSSTLAAQLAADQAVVAADKSALSAATAPQVSSAQRQQDSLQVQQAQTALNNAQAALASAQATGQANVASAQATLVAAESLASADAAQYKQACPTGPIPPAANLSGQDFTTAENLYQYCQQRQGQVAKDDSTVQQDQALVGVAQAQAQQAINEAQANVNSAQSALNIANYQQTYQGSATNPTAQAQAEANLNQAEGALAAAEETYNQAAIVAPGPGVVAEIYGAVGEYLGPDGVHQYSGPQAINTNQSSGFSLFPAQPTQAGNTNTTSVEPTIEVVGGQQQVTAQVPESSVHDLPVGHRVTVSISALNVNTTGTVTAVVLSPAGLKTSITYDVVVSLDRTVSGLLPGMSASVHP